MFLFRRSGLLIRAERLDLRLPRMADHMAWTALRQDGAEFLAPWEPARDPDHLGLRAFRARVAWAHQALEEDRALPLFLIRRADQALLGGITLDNIRRGPSESASVGYWIGAGFARQGYMAEALAAVVDHAFQVMGLSRIEAGCLPENKPSRGLLEKTGFKYEGVAQSYLQIAGRWRTHVLYANLRRDRRGASEAR